MAGWPTKCGSILGAPRQSPPQIPLENGCLVEPLAVALHGINRAEVAAGARVLVIGAGPIGLCAIAAARAHGAQVDLLAHRPRRIEAGERVGASTSVGIDYDVVLDAAGTQSSMDEAVAKVRAGGTIGILGTFWDPVAIGVALQMKEATLVPAFTYGHHHGVSEFEEAIRLLGDAPELPGAIITHRFSLDEAPEAFRVAGDPSGEAIKVAVYP